jgi:hypothetical protein
MNKLEKDYVVYSMSSLHSEQKNKSGDSTKKIGFDVSSLISFLKNNEDKLFQFEQLFNNLSDDTLFICDKAYEADLRFLFRYIFDRYEYSLVESLGTEGLTESVTITIRVKRIVDLSDNELSIFFESFCEKLYGQSQKKQYE